MLRTTCEICSHIIKESSRWWTNSIPWYWQPTKHTTCCIWNETICHCASLIQHCWSMIVSTLRTQHGIQTCTFWNFWMCVVPAASAVWTIEMITAICWCCICRSCAATYIIVYRFNITKENSSSRLCWIITTQRTYCNVKMDITYIGMITFAFIWCFRDNIPYLLECE